MSVKEIHVLTEQRLEQLLPEGGSDSLPDTGETVDVEKGEATLGEVQFDHLDGGVVDEVSEGLSTSYVVSDDVYNVTEQLWEMNVKEGDKKGAGEGQKELKGVGKEEREKRSPVKVFIRLRKNIIANTSRDPALCLAGSLVKQNSNAHKTGHSTESEPAFYEG